MRMFLFFAVAIVPVLSMLPASTLTAAAQDAPSGDVIVVLEGRDVPSSVQNIVDSVGFKVSFSNVFTGFALTLNQAQANALAQADGVLGVFADTPVELASTDALGVQRIGAPSSEQMPTPTQVSATVAVVDTGVLASHANLNVIGGFDAYTAVNANAGIDCGA